MKTEAMTQRLYHFECPECCYDDAEHGSLATEAERLCPLCASDSLHLVYLKRWPASEDEQNASPRP